MKPGSGLHMYAHGLGEQWFYRGLTCEFDAQQTPHAECPVISTQTGWTSGLLFLLEGQIGLIIIKTRSSLGPCTQ